MADERKSRNNSDKRYIEYRERRPIGDRINKITNITDTVPPERGPRTPRRTDGDGDGSDSGSE